MALILNLLAKKRDSTLLDENLGQPKKRVGVSSPLSMESDAAAVASTKASAQEALASLPSEGVAFACAYGSRYLENAKSSQLDLLVAVENSHLDAWHYQNLRQNPKHYFLSTVPPLAYGLATNVRDRKTHSIDCASQTS